MEKCLAFVLGSGGSRGAMEVGALRALLQAGIKPDLLVGTSIGAVNAAGLAVWGVGPSGVTRLERFFNKAASANLLDPQVPRVTLRALVGGPNQDTGRRLAGYLAQRGFPTDIRFGQIEGVRVGLVAADLEAGQPIIYGQNPEERVLDGILASSAVPPWFAPVQRDGHMVIDGGAYSNLPIEAALILGATEIIALPLEIPRPGPENASDLYHVLDRLVASMGRREIQLEMALAEAKNVSVRTIHLKVPEGIPMWDFGHSSELIQAGYEMAKGAIADWSGEG
jgi:NTE family protein